MYATHFVRTTSAHCNQILRHYGYISTSLSCNIARVVSKPPIHSIAHLQKFESRGVTRLISQVVAFPTDEEAGKADKVWAKGLPFKGRVTSMNPKKAKSPKMKMGSDAVLGFAKSVAAKKKQQGAGGKGKKEGGSGAPGRTGISRIAPPGTEVLLVVAPKQTELMVSVPCGWLFVGIRVWRGGALHAVLRVHLLA